MYSANHKDGIWSCKDCNWIHKRRITENIFALIRENRRRVKKAMPQPTHVKNSKTGIIILGHGSKLKKANDSLNKTIEIIKQKTKCDIIVPAYLQFSESDLTKNIKNLTDKGCRKIIIIPFFLFNGNHVSRDIPAIIKKEKAKYPEINFKYTRNLSGDTRIADIVSDIIKEAV